MALKIGIEKIKSEDEKLIKELLTIMEFKSLDFTNTFRLLTLRKYASLNVIESSELIEWIKKWESRLTEQNVDIEEAVTIMKKHNPNIIPRNSLVEEALANASLNNDYDLFNEMLELLKNPFNYEIEYKNKFTSFKKKRADYVTYCGT
mgnify:FL=1